MSDAVIGALRVSLGLDSAAFEKGLSGSQKTLARFNKDMQRASANFTAIGKTLTLGLTVPIAGLGVASIRAAKESADAFGQVEAALQSMGAVSGKTLDDLGKQADRLMNASLFDDDDILRNVTANMLTFGNIAGANFDRAQVAVVDLATRMKMDLQSATVLVGKALNDPLKGLTALTRAGIQFTDGQRAAIASMVKAGDVAGAQAIMLGELEKQFGGAAKAAQNADPFNKFRDAMDSMSEAIGNKLLPVLTPLINSVTRAIEGFNGLAPPLQNAILLAAGVGAVVGPLTIALGALTSAIGTIAVSLGVAGAETALLGAALTLLTGPVGLVVAGIAAATGGMLLLINANNKAAIATRANKTEHEKLDPILRTVKLSLDAAAGSSGKVRDMHLKAADAAFQLGEAELDSARKAVAAGKARLKAAQDSERMAMQSGTGSPYSFIPAGIEATRLAKAEAELKAAEDILIAAGRGKRTGSRGQGTRFTVIRPSEAPTQQPPAALDTPLGNLTSSVQGVDRAAKDAAPPLSEFNDLMEAFGRQMPKLTQGAQLIPGLFNPALTQNGPGKPSPIDEQHSAGSGQGGGAMKWWGGSVFSEDQVATMRGQFIGFGKDLASAIKNKDLGSFFESLGARFADRLMEDSLNRLFDALGSIGSGSGDGTLGKIFGAIFGGGGGSKIPGFATGGSFTMGGSGGIDSKLAMFRMTPGEMVNITHGDTGPRGGSTNLFDLRGAVLTQDLLNQMNQIAAQGDIRVYGQLKGERAREAQAQRYRVAR